MLEAWLRYYSEGKHEIYSAGVETRGINLEAVYYMNEVGVDISNHSSGLLDKYLKIEFDLIVTVCNHAKESCPIFPKAVKVIHRNFEDPSKAVEEKSKAFRIVRTELEDFAKYLVKI